MSTLDATRTTTARRDSRATVRPSLALALLATGLLHLAAGLISPQLKSSAAGQLAVVAAHPTRWYWYTILLILGGVVAVPAMIALLQLGAARMRRVGTIGGLLVVLGFLGSIVDCANQLWEWQMVKPGADRSQMAALLDRFDNAAASNAPFAVTGIGLLIGTLLLCTALIRHPDVPTAAALFFGAAVFVNIAAFSANSAVGVAASFGLLLVGTGWIGLSQLRRPPAARAGSRFDIGPPPAA